METTEYLDEYYRNYDEDGRLGSRHGNVEFLTTMTYIQKYLRPGMRVLEIGAATGRYSHAIARMGYRVDAVELIEHNIELFRRLVYGIGLGDLHGVFHMKKIHFCPPFGSGFWR